jgi:hypothetical protein
LNGSVETLCDRTKASTLEEERKETGIGNPAWKIKGSKDGKGY